MLAESAPAFSHLFGIHPWDLDRLTYREIGIYQEFIDTMTRGDDG